MTRQASMSYPGQGRPADAAGSSQDKAGPSRSKGRSKPSTQENIHPNTVKAGEKKKPSRQAREGG